MKSIILIGAILIFAGCAATELTTEGQRVRITYDEPGKECKFLGVVTGSQGSALTGGITSNKNMEIGALNDLRNQAAELGGNIILILTQRAGQTADAGGASRQTNVTITGNVYSCPE